MRSKSPKTFNEMKMSVSCEHKDFVRKKRYFRHLPNKWDDVCSIISKCWKDQNKIKKSWMKNLT